MAAHGRWHGLVLWLGVAALPAGGMAQPMTRQQPVVVVSYDDTGDFGPQTPGTTTGGWQEAIDYCVAHHRDLYAKGGWGGRDAIYHIHDTIRIPPTQDFRIDSGVYVLNWEGPADRDLLLVDSGMDCHFRFGILVYGGSGAALRVRPAGKVPIDGFAVFTDSEIEASSIADPRPFTRGERKAGAGVVFDTSQASICFCDFRFTSVCNFATCIAAPDTGAAFTMNKLECLHLHTNADRSTLLNLGEKCSKNQLDLRLAVDQGAQGVRGVVIGGASNTLELATVGGFPKGGDVIFTASAEGNQVNLRGDGDPLALVTDHAAVPTNQLTWAGSPLPVQTIKGSAGTFTHTQRLVPATVRVKAAAKAKVALLRGKARVDCGPGEVTLSVGDRLLVESATAPVLVVTPLKAR